MTAGASTGETRVALLSNYHTRNLGNLALTRAVQRLLTNRFGSSRLLALRRLPHPVATLATKGDVEKWASALSRQIGSFESLPRPAATSFGELVPTLASAAKENSTPSRTRAAAVRLAHTSAATHLRARLDREEARAHVGALLSATDLVWNPAGEFNAYSTPTTRLLDVAVALDQRRRVSIVNFSFEATPEALAFLAGTASRLHRVLGRDERTVDTMIDLGVKPEAARLSPDAVFLVGSALLPEIARPPRREHRDVLGIVLHGLTPIDAEQWARVVAGARRDGLAVEVLSSHRAIDGAVIKQLVDQAGGDNVTVVPEFTDIEAYLTHLGSLHAVVTARFHTAVLGLLAGTTVVGVDTYGAKIAGGLATAGFSGAVASGADWPEEAEAIITSGPTAAAADIDRVTAEIQRVWGEAFSSGTG